MRIRGPPIKKRIPAILIQKGVIYISELYHFGIKGMKWGIRRYQNYDGSLTPEGRTRIGLDKYDRDHSEDIVLKKGTKASRVVDTKDYEYEKDPDFGGNAERGKKYLKKILDDDKNLENKYLSIDGIRNSGRSNGKDFYTNWFTNEGYQPDSAVVTTYTLNKDVRIASGKKVVDALLRELGPEKITETLEKDSDVRKLTLEYTNNKYLRDRINQKFKDLGYDGVEDINDLDTDLPIILFDSVKNATRSNKVQSGAEALDELWKRLEERTY